MLCSTSSSLQDPSLWSSFYLVAEGRETWTVTHRLLKLPPVSNACHFYHTSFPTPVVSSLLSLAGHKCIKPSQGGMQQGEKRKYFLQHYNLPQLPSSQFIPKCKYTSLLSCLIISILLYYL